MNKTVTVNLGGSIFNIEEEAYQALRRYLDLIKQNFTGDPGEAEIMADIEVRLAELLQERIDEVRNVVTMAHVTEVSAIMGQPEDFAPDGAKASAAAAAGHTRHDKRRVYRDRDDAVLGGVCSGFSYYFGWDPIVLRIAFVLFGILSAGTAVIAYIILWAVIPEARTTAEKLQMRGEPVNVDSISRFINSEAQRAAENVNKWSKRKFQGPPHNRHGEIGRGLGIALTKIVGAFMVIGGFVLLASLILMFAFAEGGLPGSTDLSVSRAAELIFAGTGSYIMLTLGIALLLGIPAISLLYGGFKLLIGSARHVRGLGWVLAVLFVTGVALTVVGGMRIGREFSSDAEIREQREIAAGADTLYVRVLPDTLFPGRTHDDFNDFFGLITSDGSTTWYGEPVRLDFEESDSDQFSVRIKRLSRGPGKRAAGDYVMRINYDWAATGDTLDLTPWFSTPSTDPFRGQHVEITVFVPRGKYVRFGHDIGLIWWDSWMAGKTRRMFNGRWDEGQALQERQQE